jgi:hypothetical protein
MKIGFVLDKEAFRIVPGEYTFPEDKEKFTKDHTKGTIYIAKPVASSEGNSILLFKE